VSKDEGPKVAKPPGRLAAELKQMQKQRPKATTKARPERRPAAQSSAAASPSATLLPGADGRAAFPGLPRTTGEVSELVPLQTDLEFPLDGLLRASCRSLTSQRRVGCCDILVGSTAPGPLF